MLFESELTEHDRQILHQIESDIKKNPDKYRESGERLDEYTNITAYWQRRIDRFKLRYTSILKESHNLRETLVSHSALASWGLLKSIWWIMKLNVKRTKRDTYLVGIDISFWNSKKGKNLKRQQIYEKLLEKQKKGQSVSYRERFEDWFDRLFLYTLRYPLLLEASLARDILLTTWVLIDPDLNCSNLGITEFEQWSFYERQLTLRSSIYFKEKKVTVIWMKAVKAARAKIEAEKEYKASTNSQDTDKFDMELPKDIELDEVDKAIIKIYQEAEKQALKNPKSKIKLPGSRKIAKALCKTGITPKKYSHTAIDKRRQKLRDMGLIGHPDDGKDTAKRCTNKYIDDMEGDGEVKQKF